MLTKFPAMRYVKVFIDYEYTLVLVLSPACVTCGVTCLVYTSTYNVVFGGQEIRNGDQSIPYLPLDKVRWCSLLEIYSLSVKQLRSSPCLGMRLNYSLTHSFCFVLLHAKSVRVRENQCAHSTMLLLLLLGDGLELRLTCMRFGVVMVH